MAKKAKKYCGMDVHESNLTCAIIDLEDNIVGEQIFRNDVMGHMKLIKWLRKNRVRHVGLESTGVYWKAMAHTLRAHGMLVKVGNAQEMKNVPGKKTDKLDAKRIARLLRDGYIPHSNLLSQAEEDFRILIRTRLHLLRQKIATKNRISASIARIGLRLKTSDKFGRIGRKLLKLIASGQDITPLFESDRVKKLGYTKETLLSAIEEHITPTIRKQLSILLTLLEQLEAQIGKIEEAISIFISEDKQLTDQMKIVKSIPGFSDIASPIVLAEIGDIRAFRSGKAFSSYLGLVPTIYQSGERTKDGITIKKAFMGRLRSRSNRRLKWIFIMAANVIIRLPDSPLVTSLKAFYNRIKNLGRGRYAKQKAIVALAHKLAKIAWTLLTRGEIFKGQQGCIKKISNRKRRIKHNSEATEKILDQVITVLSKAEAIKLPNKALPSG